MTTEAVHPFHAFEKIQFQLDWTPAPKKRLKPKRSTHHGSDRLVLDITCAKFPIACPPPSLHIPPLMMEALLQCKSFQRPPTYLDCVFPLVCINSCSAGAWTLTGQSAETPSTERAPLTRTILRSAAGESRGNQPCHPYELGRFALSALFSAAHCCALTALNRSRLSIGKGESASPRNYSSNVVFIQICGNSDGNVLRYWFSYSSRVSQTSVWQSVTDCYLNVS